MRRSDRKAGVKDPSEAGDGPDGLLSRPYTRRQVVGGMSVAAAGAATAPFLLGGASASAANTSTGTGSSTGLSVPAGSFLFATITQVNGTAVSYLPKQGTSSKSVDVSGGGVLLPIRPLEVGDEVLVELDPSSAEPIAFDRRTDQFIATVRSIGPTSITVSNASSSSQVISMPSSFLTIVAAYPGYEPIAAQSQLSPGDSVMLKTQYSPAAGNQEAFFVARVA